MIQWNGTNLLQLIEWAAAADPRAKHAISTANLRIANQTLLQRNTAPVTTTAGFLYSGDTFTPTGLLLNGAQTVFQQPGCRPRIGTAIWTSGSAGTAFINRFTDGEVWVSGSPNVRSGSRISNSIASLANPRGIRYLIVTIIGGGGGGGGAGNALQSSAGGGGGGATAVCCIRLPINGHATLVVGAGGGGNTGTGRGGSGTVSSITCGGFSCSVGGGQGGGGHSDSGALGLGGTLAAITGDGGDGFLIANTAGSSGGARRTAGTGRNLNFTNYSPEGGAISWSAVGGGSTDSAGNGGGGGASSRGNGGLGGSGTGGRRGGNGIAPGGGAGGGGNNITNDSRRWGGDGAVGLVQLHY